MAAVNGLARRCYLSLSTLLIIGIVGWGGTTQAQSGSSADREAHLLFQAGVEALSEGRYDSALSSFERAYELSGRAELLYNIGVAADRSRQDERAIEAFERYLEEMPDADERTEVEARLRILRESVLERDGEGGGAVAAVPAAAGTAGAASSSAGSGSPPDVGVETVQGAGGVGDEDTAEQSLAVDQAFDDTRLKRSYWFVGTGGVLVVAGVMMITLANLLVDIDPNDPDAGYARYDRTWGSGVAVMVLGSLLLAPSLGIMGRQLKRRNRSRAGQSAIEVRGVSLDVGRAQNGVRPLRIFADFAF